LYSVLSQHQASKKNTLKTALACSGAEINGFLVFEDDLESVFGLL